jgi:hypothetical protein
MENETTNCTKETTEMVEKCTKHGKTGSNSSGNAFYGLGLIGALIFFISKASGFWAVVLAILKAIVWPVFFVLEGVKHFYN